MRLDDAMQVHHDDATQVHLDHNNASASRPQQRMCITTTTTHVHHARNNDATQIHFDHNNGATHVHPDRNNACASRL
jgi:hypothetical protein